MDFSLTDEQIALVETFRRFTNTEVRPAAEAVDEAEVFPDALFRKVGKLGFFGMRYPEEDGGAGAGVMAACLAVEELARGSMSLAAACTMQSLMGTYFLWRFGGAEHKARLFRPALEGEKVGTICMTEPDAGSDLAGVKTRAEKTGDGYVISGQKMWITSAPVADFFTVLARTSSAEKDNLGFFLVERDTPGLVVGRSIRKMGVRASVTSEVALDQCLVPLEAALGEPGKGMTYLREILDEIRIITGAMALGGAQGALDDSLEYARQRVQFGRPIAKFQAIQIRLADMATDLAAARHMVRHAAWMSDQGIPRTREAAMAKYFASEAALRVCEHAARVMAAYGYAMEYPIQRHLRDIRFTLIGGGTSEMMQLTIAREL